MAGIGFDAEAVKEVPPDVKGLIGAPAYVLSGLKALAQLPPSLSYRMRLDGPLLVSRGLMLVVANAASYAGPLTIAPKGSIEDGLLDVCLFRERGRLAFLLQFLRVLLGRRSDDPRLLYLNGRKLNVECRPPAAVQLDGDYFGRTPVEISVLPAALRVVRPG